MTQITVGSLFAGIGGFDLAAERAGFRVEWQSEVDKYSNRVLDHHWPNVPNLGDINDIREPQWVDILAGGFPCQSYSVAGTRGGLADDRGALWWQYHRLIDQIRPTWVVGENVPGLLSSAGGRDFETIIRSLTEIGYGVVWAVLDSQYFGVAQRRRRVFIVGHSGGIPRPEILALAEGMFGHPAPSREAEQDLAASLESRPTSDRLRAERGHIVGTLRAGQGPANLDHQAVEAGQIIGFTPGASALVTVEGAAPTMTGRHGDQGAIAFVPGSLANAEEILPTMTTEHGGQGGVVHAMTMAADDEGEDISPSLKSVHGSGSKVIIHAPEVAGALRSRDAKGPAMDVAEPNVVTYVSKTAQTGSNGLGISGKDIDGEETAHTLDSSGPEAVIQVFEDDRRSGPRIHDEVGPTLTARMGEGGNNMPMVFAQNQRAEVRDLKDVAGSLSAQPGMKQQTYVAESEIYDEEDIRIRKLTPLECERLQGFPDQWTGIPKNSDTQRYKQLGNAVTVNVVEWIMRRIAATYDDIYLK